MTTFPLPPLQSDRHRAAWARQIDVLLDRVDLTQTKLGERIAKRPGVTPAGSTLGPQITKFKMGDPSTLRQWMEVEETPRLRALAQELGLPDTAAFYEAHRRARGGADSGTGWHPGFPSLENGQVEVRARLGGHGVEHHGEQLWSAWARWQRDKDAEAAAPPFLRIVGAPGSGRRTAARQVAEAAHAYALKDTDAKRSPRAAAPLEPRRAQIVDVDAGETADPERGPVIEVSTVPRPFEGFDRPGLHVAPAPWGAADIAELCGALRPHLEPREQQDLDQLLKVVQKHGLWAAPFRWPSQVIRMIADALTEGVDEAPVAARDRLLKAEWARVIELDGAGRLAGLDAAFWGELWLSRLREEGPAGFGPASGEVLIHCIRGLLEGRGLGEGVRRDLLTRVVAARSQGRVKGIHDELDHIERLLRVDDAEGVFQSLCAAGCLREQGGEWAPTDVDTAILAAVAAWGDGQPLAPEVEGPLLRSPEGAIWWRELGLRGWAGPLVEGVVDQVDASNWVYAGPVLAVFLQGGGRLRADQVVRVWACTLAILMRACALNGRYWRNPVGAGAAHAALRQISKDYVEILPMIDPSDRWASIAEHIPAAALRVIEATATPGMAARTENSDLQLRRWAQCAPSQALPASWEEWAGLQSRDWVDAVLSAVVEAARRGHAPAQDWLAGVGVPSAAWDDLWVSLPWRLRARWLHRHEAGELLEWAWGSVLDAAWAELGRGSEAPKPEWSVLLKRADTLGLREATAQRVAEQLSVAALLHHVSQYYGQAANAVPWQALYTAAALEDWDLLVAAAAQRVTLVDLVEKGLHLKGRSLMVVGHTPPAVLGDPTSAGKADEAGAAPVRDGVTRLVRAALNRVEDTAFAAARLLLAAGRPEAMRARLDLDPVAGLTAHALNHLSRLSAVVEMNAGDALQRLDRVAFVERPPEEDLEQARLAVTGSSADWGLQGLPNLLSALDADPRVACLLQVGAALAFDSTLAVPDSVWDCLVRMFRAARLAGMSLHSNLQPERSVLALLDHGDMTPIQRWLSGEERAWTRDLISRLEEDPTLLTRAWGLDCAGPRRKELLQLALHFLGGGQLHHRWARAAFCEQLDEVCRDGSAWADLEKLPRHSFPRLDIGVIRHQLLRFPEDEAPLLQLRVAEPGAPELREALQAWLEEHDPVARVARAGGTPRPRALPFDQMIGLAASLVPSLEVARDEVRAGLERLWRSHVVRLPLKGATAGRSDFALSADWEFDWLWDLMKTMRLLDLSSVLVDTFRDPPAEQEGDPRATARAEVLCRLTLGDWRKVASPEERRAVGEARGIQALVSGVLLEGGPRPVELDALPWGQPEPEPESLWVDVFASVSAQKAARVVELVKQHAPDWSAEARLSMGRALLVAEPLRGLGLELLQADVPEPGRQCLPPEPTV
jgi:hypothetical protein